MKMRKILPLLILAVGSVVLLSGCDALLDAIFQNNQISVDVAVTASTHTDYPVGGYVAVNLFNQSTGTLTTATSTWASYDGFYVHYYFTFTKLKDDTFTITSTYYTYNGFINGTTGYMYVDNIGIGSVITMPRSSSVDSTGHSVNVVEYL